MGADSESLTLLTRTPDLRQARHTSVIEDIRLWLDAEGISPALPLYALNLFDLEENDLYRRYSRRSPEAVTKHGGKVVAAGTG